MTELKLSLIMLTAPFLALYCLSQVLADVALYSQVRDFGTPATAVVDTIETAALFGRPGGGRTVTYTLHLPGRVMINGAAHMSRTDAAQFQPGEVIQIVYASSDPSRTALSVAHAWRALVSDLIAVGAYILVLAVTVILWRAAPRTRAQEYGAAAG